MPDAFNLKVVGIAGSGSTDDGRGVLVGLDVDGVGVVNLDLGQADAIQLIAIVSAAAGQAERIRSGDPTTKHSFAAEQCEIAHAVNGSLVRFSWKLAGGAELSFQISREAAHAVHDALGASLAEAAAAEKQRPAVH